MTDTTTTGAAVDKTQVSDDPLLRTEDVTVT